MSIDQSLADFDDTESYKANDRPQELFNHSSEPKVEIDDLKNILMDETRLERGGTIVGNDVTDLTAKIETIEKMSSDVLQIFIKIREQLQQYDHPLRRICAKFQELFIKQIDREVSELLS